MLVEWSESFVVGHSLIDREHRDLVDLVNQTQHAVTDPSDTQAVSDRLLAILIRTEQHFEHEEQIMRDFSYPFVHKHRTAHQELVRLTSTMIRDAEGQEALLRALSLTASALADHMRGYDGLFSTYLKDNGCFGVI